MQGQKKCFYDFETFRIDTLKRQLLRDGSVVPITSKAFTTLLILVERRGETVTKEELMNAVWFDTAVEENNLTQQISTLRKVLGEQIREPKFIITVPGQGYCFIAQVKAYECERIEADVSKDDVEIEVSKTNRIKQDERRPIKDWNFPQIIHILRAAFIFLLVGTALFSFFYFSSFPNPKSAICIAAFKSLDNNEKSNLYSAGIPSYVTAKIGEIPNVIVRPLDTPEKYYGDYQTILAVARNSNIDAVLTGSTLCEGESVQVIVHLWDVKNNRQIWGKVFTKNAADSLSVQENISEEIISALRSELAN
jgi:DNA-binding winged helix-turn-helix (wHTH) protein/TolB-like protein